MIATLFPIRRTTPDEGLDIGLLCTDGRPSIHQDMSRAAAIALDAIVNHSVRRPVTIERVPVEVILRENIR